MKWYDSPFMMLIIFLVLLLLFVLTGSLFFLVVAIPPLMYLILAVIEQPQLITSPMAASFNNRATRYVQRNNLAEAIRMYSVAIERNPRYAQPYLNRGLLYMERGRHDEAYNDLSKALMLRDDLIDAYAARGRIHLLRGDSAAALADWLRAEQLGGSALAFVLRGDYYLHKGKHLDALKDFKDAAHMAPKNAPYLSNYAYVAAMVGEAEEALRFAERGVTLDPYQVTSFTARGTAHFRLHHYEQALADFLRAVEIMPDFPYALVGQAAAYYALGSVKEALRAWEYLVAHHPRYADAEALAVDYGAVGTLLDTAHEVASRWQTDRAEREAARTPGSGLSATDERLN